VETARGIADTKKESLLEIDAEITAKRESLAALQSEIDSLKKKFA
jgi:hypothetical protein